MFLCESGTYQCRESGQPGRGNKLPVLQNSWLTELVQTHVVIWDGGGGQEFWRSLWVVMHGEAGVPTPSSRGGCRPSQQRGRPERIGCIHYPGL